MAYPFISRLPVALWRLIASPYFSSPSRLGSFSEYLAVLKAIIQGPDELFVAAFVLNFAESFQNEPDVMQKIIEMIERVEFADFVSQVVRNSNYADLASILFYFRRCRLLEEDSTVNIRWLKLFNLRQPKSFNDLPTSKEMHFPGFYNNYVAFHRDSLFLSPYFQEANQNRESRGRVGYPASIRTVCDHDSRDCRRGGGVLPSTRNPDN